MYGLSIWNRQIFHQSYNLCKNESCKLCKYILTFNLSVTFSTLKILNANENARTTKIEELVNDWLWIIIIKGKINPDVRFFERKNKQSPQMQYFVIHQLWAKWKNEDFVAGLHFWRKESSHLRSFTIDVSNP